MVRLIAQLRTKVDRIATAETFREARFPTLSRMLAKEGVGDGTGLADDVLTGLLLFQLVDDLLADAWLV